MVIALVATCLGKVVSGVFVGRHRWVVGTAMMGRGEFAYLVAQTALITPFRAFSGGGDVAGEATMLSPDAYTSVVWALLTATVLTPFLFKLLLSRMARLEQGAPGDPGGDEALVKKWKIRIAHDLSPPLAASPAGGGGGGERGGGGTSRSPRGSLTVPPPPPPPQNLMQALASEGLDITAFEIISGGLLRSYNEVYTVEVTDDRVDKALRADVEAIEEKMHRIVNNTMQADQRYNLLIKPIRPGQLSRDCSLAIRPAALQDPESPQPLAPFAGGAPKAPEGGPPRAGASGPVTPASLVAALEAAAGGGRGPGPAAGGAGAEASLLPRGGSLKPSSSKEGGQAPPLRGATPPQNLKLSMHFSEDPEYYGQLVSHLVETSMSNSRASRLSDLDQGSGVDEETAGPVPQQARRSLFGGLRRGRVEEKEKEEEEKTQKKKKKKKKKEKKEKEKNGE